MSKVNDLRKQIVSNLENISEIEDVQEVVCLRSPKDLPAISGYPMVMCAPPGITSDPNTNRDNLRNNAFTSRVFMKNEETEPKDVCDLQETILDKFDNDLTLGGELDLALAPAITDPAPYRVAGNDYVKFELILSAKNCATVSL